MTGNLKPVGRPTTANAITAIVAEEDFWNLNWEGYTSIEALTGFIFCGLSMSYRAIVN